MKLIDLTIDSSLSLNPALNLFAIRSMLKLLLLGEFVNLYLQK